MKPFDLKIYISNPNLEIITREGNPAKIIYTNRKGYNAKPIIALITIPNGTEVIKTYWENGIETQGYTDNPNDLFFKPVKRIGWINIYNPPNSLCNSLIASTVLSYTLVRVGLLTSNAVMSPKSV